ncbi:MAG: TlyA family RNA methyltransferase [Candidatus Tokpelaia sp.]|nr:MAG: TlyA family RNA methyltransferase [Candidatus Tokpelaia sp.]KAA6206752.1 MAG: TlyA family RNA methyltransferase [Candidatus Tokpelaia sp.]
MRLDNVLVARGFFGSRARARDAVLRGTVRLAGEIVARPGLLVATGAALEVADPVRAYVSRAALKLLAALERFGLSPRGARAADIGASTGGFSQVLLERGARHVTAIDVGHGQMAANLRTDKRLTLYEGLNARAVTAAHFTGKDGLHRPDFIVSDVSFISLKLALPPVLQLAAAGAKAVLLVKPQFEAGRENIGKGGQLLDRAQAKMIAQELYHWLDSLPQWRACGLCESPISGGEGAQEFLLYGEKQSLAEPEPGPAGRWKTNNKDAGNG